MFKRIIGIFLILSVLSCKEDAKKQTTVVDNEEAPKELAYASFGMEISDTDALDAFSMAKHFKTMQVGDSINSKFTGTIKEVCSKKGCWMTLDIGNGEEVMVRFKDYGFFMPLDAKGEVIVNGKAFVNETSVDELRHYAEDAGKSDEEINAITEPKNTFAFEADGVLLKQ